MDKEERNQFRDAMRQERHMMFHRRNWLRHNAMVPKGFLRYHVLSALNDKPMSGSELMDQLQKQTGGHWKPSPGSIYPLLAWLQDNQYIQELPPENGLKRYQLTQSGKELLEEQTKIREKFTADAGFMGSPFFDHFCHEVPEEKTCQIRTSLKRLMVASMAIGKTLRENYSEKTLDEALKVLDEASAKLEEMNKHLKGESP
ncbi:MAG: PadR family transcriptional regulator [Candidatus Bathyarchaeota archaeon]|nr:PadR family transcriptional regulator [Candidatus Bathyarchaeota archaeon]